jgi:hypothetical protein
MSDVLLSLIKESKHPYLITTCYGLTYNIVTEYYFNGDIKERTVPAGIIQSPIINWFNLY